MFHSFKLKQLTLALTAAVALTGMLSASAQPSEPAVAPVAVTGDAAPNNPNSTASADFTRSECHSEGQCQSWAPKRPDISGAPGSGWGRVIYGDHIRMLSDQDADSETADSADHPEQEVTYHSTTHIED
ncbi:MAG: hypothetical protein COV52_02805 [Gammaproteobacteria bacterium CG11_big_fil_rev_8_21_14_0_20_46_22]|nr:MAG: hypothetical protein COW05_08840 [Gammaproteobacteria bacterium CG12_big_fil_rev_8_21_14_0_65_46_12]PIR11707.1 MAG: hypothetical protein COV52_02805 [Gammaproteobacteria bacterium CG11_big_fil_rev_8_21_14_0_20_46_22]